jgi:threonine dehydrogenase-like Zn-dependent dehydrogenase
MKALIFDKTLRYVTTHPRPEPPRGEALIRVSMAGICDTDIQITKGYMGFSGIPGHEFVGIVEGINGDDQSLKGKRVVGGINCGCGICDWCLRGLGRHCPERTTLGISGRDGAFAEFVTVPLANLYEVPENVTDEEAVFTEPLAAAFEILEQVRPRPTDRVLVMGDGKLGILSALVLASTGAEVTLAGRHREKLKRAGDAGVQKIELWDSTFEIRNSKFHMFYDVVVEATGSPLGFENAMASVKPRGTIILKTTVAEGSMLNLWPVVVNEITVVGSRCGPFEPALRALSQKCIDVRPLITAAFPFDEALEAFARAQQGGSLKVLMAMR